MEQSDVIVHLAAAEGVKLSFEQPLRSFTTPIVTFPRLVHQALRGDYLTVFCDGHQTRCSGR